MLNSLLSWWGVDKWCLKLKTKQEVAWREQLQKLKVVSGMGGNEEKGWLVFLLVKQKVQTSSKPVLKKLFWLLQ